MSRILTSKMSRLEFSIDKLIKEVRKRRLLYDTTISQYRDVKAKEREWVEVCREMCKTNVEINDWDNLSETEKTDFLIEVKKKWSSLRDCFKREQRLLDKNKHNKRKYLFFDELKFLEPFKRSRAPKQTQEVEHKLVHEEIFINDDVTIKEEIENNNSDCEEVDENPLSKLVEVKEDNISKTIKILTPQEISSIRGKNIVAIENKGEKESLNSYNHPSSSFIQSFDASSPDEEKSIDKRKRKREIDKNNDDYEKNKMTIIEYDGGEASGCGDSKREDVKIKMEGFDDDQAFLKSILPTFKPLTTEQKYQLRIEIMQTILKFKVDNKIFN